MSDVQEYLSFEQLVDLLEVEERDEQLPGWPQPVRIRPLTIEESSQIGKDAGGNGDRAAQLMVQRCLVRPALTDAQIRVIWTKQAGKFKPLIDRLNAINGFGPPEQQKAQEEAAEATFRPQSDPAT